MIEPTPRSGRSGLNNPFACAGLAGAWPVGGTAARSMQALRIAGQD